MLNNFVLFFTTNSAIASARARFKMKAVKRSNVVYSIIIHLVCWFFGKCIQTPDCCKNIFAKQKLSSYVLEMLVLN